jgi:hypothetical protein
MTMRVYCFLFSMFYVTIVDIHLWKVFLGMFWQLANRMSLVIFRLKDFLGLEVNDKQHRENSKIWFLDNRKTLGEGCKKKHQISLNNVREMPKRCQVTLKNVQQCWEHVKGH